MVKNQITNNEHSIPFIHKKIKSKSIAKKLVKNGVGTRNDNFYAWRCLKYLGIDPDDGVIRISMVHYNTINEVNKLIKIFKKLFKYLLMILFFLKLKNKYKIKYTLLKITTSKKDKNK